VCDRAADCRYQAGRRVGLVDMRTLMARLNASVATDADVEAMVSFFPESSGGAHPLALGALGDKCPSRCCLLYCRVLYCPPLSSTVQSFSF
jgi:hypothetical protein